MQPRKFFEPLLVRVFHVTNKGWSSAELAGLSCRLSRRGREKKDDREDDFDVAEEASVAAEDAETVDGTEEDDAVDGLGARRRLIAAGL